MSESFFYVGHEEAGDDDASFEDTPPAPQPPPAPKAPGHWGAWRVLFAINIIVFVAMVLKGADPIHISQQSLVKWGANVGHLAMTTEPWRLVTSMFLHGGLIYVGANMYCLYLLGPTAETMFGTRRFLTLYLLSGLGAGIIGVAWHPMTMRSGASGPIFGLLGGMLGFVLRRKDEIDPKASKAFLKNILFNVGINIFIAFAIPNVDFSANIGGFATGCLLGFFVMDWKNSARRKSAAPEWIATCAIIMALAGGGVYAQQRATATPPSMAFQQLMMEEAKFGNTTINYDRSVPKEIVTKLGDELKIIKYAESRATVLIFKSGERAEIGFVVNPDIAMRGDNLSQFKSFALYFSKRVFDDKPVDMRFFDTLMKELKTIKWEDSVGDEKIAF